MPRFGSFEIDAQRHELRLHGKPVAVQRKVFDLLLYLIQHRERTVPKEELLRAVWQGTCVSDASLNVQVSALRKALGDDPRRPKWIATVHGRGYRFVGELLPEDTAAPEGLEATTLTPSLRGESLDPLLGREAEQELISRTLEHARAGRGRVLLLEGEPGIGKSRLLDWCAENARRDGMCVLTGNCREDVGAPPLWPWAQIVRQLVDRDAGGELRAHLPALLHAFPDLGLAGLQPAAGSLTTLQVYTALARLIAAQALKQPVALLLDDLHCADPSTLALLSFVARELRGAPIAVVGATRPAQGEVADALGLLLRQPHALDVLLRGLTRGAVEAWMASALGASFSAELAEHLWQQTSGNPFFLRQLLPIARLSPRAEARDLPRSALRAISRHCDALPPSTRALLRLAAGFGRSFSTAQLASVAGSEAGAVLEALDPAVRARLIEPSAEEPTRLRFVHLLVRDVLYEESDARQRAALHWKIGEAIRAAVGPHDADYLAELAYHFERAAPVHGSSRAIDHHLRAGAEAARRHSNDSARTHLRTALTLMDASAEADEQQRSEALLALARVELLCGSLDAATALRLRAAEHARAIGSAERLVCAALELTSSLDGRTHRMDWSSLAPVVRSAVESCGPARPREHARLLARLAQVLELAGAATAADRALEQAQRAARGAEDQSVLAEVLCAEHLFLIGTPDHERRLHICSEMIQLARAAGDLERELMFLGYRSCEHLEQGRLEEWERERVAFTERARLLNSPEAHTTASKMLAMRALLRGEFASVHEHVERARSHAAQGDPELGVDLNGQLMAVQYYCGDLSLDALRAIETSSLWASPLWFAPVYRSLGARLDLARLLELDAARITPSRHVAWLPWVVFLADAVAFVGDQARARTLIGWLSAYAGSHAIMGGCLFYQGPVARYLGLLHGALGRWDDAIALLEDALRDAARLGARPWECQIHFDLCEAYRERGASGDAALERCHARQAATLAERLPVRPVQRQLAARGT